MKRDIRYPVNNVTVAEQIDLTAGYGFARAIKALVVKAMDGKGIAALFNAIKGTPLLSGAMLQKAN